MMLKKRIKAVAQWTMLILLLVKLNAGLGQSSDILSQKFHPDTVIATINSLHKELSLKQPGYYRYNTEEDFSHFIDSVNATIIDSLTFLEAYEKLKLVISSIHCLHTELGFSDAQTKELNDLPILFPFQLIFENERAFVVKNKSKNSMINEGDEVVHINGQSIADILRRLLPIIPSDGYNLTMKYRALYLSFPTWYRTIEYASEFNVEIKKEGQIKNYLVKGEKLKDIAEEGFIIPPTIDKQLEFKVEDDIAYLTIHTFSNSDIRRGDQKFKKFIDNSFSVIAEQGIENLIIDVRDNTGGSDSNAAYFSSYFFDKPYRYWDRVEVTASVASEIKGIIKLFYKKPVEKEGQYLWQKAKLTKEFDYYELQQPAKNSYQGKAYLLINGFCMSSCADVAAILSDNKKVVTIGQETGGGFQGNSSGMMPEAEVSPFGFMISVPLQNYFNAVNPEKNDGRGTLPDYSIEETIETVLSVEDEVLHQAMKLIKEVN